MEFIDVVFIIGIFLIIMGLFSSFTILRLSMKKTKEELKDINIANLWVLFVICLPLGLTFIYFWY